MGGFLQVVWVSQYVVIVSVSHQVKCIELITWVSGIFLLRYYLGLKCIGFLKLFSRHCLAGSLGFSPANLIGVTIAPESLVFAGGTILASRLTHAVLLIE